MSDELEVAEAAKTRLEAAVRDYYATVDPEVYVESWVLVAHKLSVELEREGTSMVGTLTPTGQSFVMTRGLLDVALSGERAQSTIVDYDDE